jgi:ABC-2 type transport system permease protein
LKHMDFVGTGKLIRLAFRQNKVLKVIWLLLPTLIAAGTYASYYSMFPTKLQLINFIHESISNPVVIGMHGQILDSTLAALTAWKIKVQLMILIGIFNIIVVMRFTRHEEESGRFELLHSTAVGRQSNLAAALISAFATNLVMGFLITFGLGMNLPLTGSITMGLMFAFSGCLFAAIAGIAAQIADSARTANSIAVCIFAAMFILSFLNNTNSQPKALLLLTPFSWFFALRPFSGNYLAYFIPIILFTMILTGVAFTLSAKRDVGAGLIHPHPGKAQASPRFRTAFALSWRLQRGMLIGWAVGLGLFGIGIGSANQTVIKMFQENSTMANWVKEYGGPNNAFIALVIFVVALFVSSYILLAVLRLRSEETNLRAEPLLSASVNRIKWAGSHIIIAILGSVILMAVVGITSGLSGGIISGDISGELSKTLGASLIKLPSIWTIAGIAVLFFGLLPRLSTGLSWTVFGGFLLIQLVWELGQTNRVVYKISPFSYVYPNHSITVLPIILLTIIASVLIAGGLVGFRHREIG